MNAMNRWVSHALIAMTFTACAVEEADVDNPGSEAVEEGAPAAASKSPSVQDDNQSADDQEALSGSEKSIFGIGTSCSPNPCLNGGTCVDQWLGYTCRCPSGFTGTRCQTAATPCQTYTAASGDKCAGLYCGLTQPQLASRLSFFAACNQPSAFTCAGTLPKVSGSCGRELKSANPLDTNEQLRPKINACIAQRPELAGVSVSSTCRNCYTSYQLCIQSNCLLECLVGDSALCDTCQRNRGCLSALYSCTGLPNPL